MQDTYYTTYKILYDATNTIPRGARSTPWLLEEKEGEEKKANTAKLHRTILKKEIQKKGDLKGDLVAA